MYTRTSLRPDRKIRTTPKMIRGRRSLRQVRRLPATPFHYPLAYLIHKVDERLSLPALVVGSMFPDLEIPVIVSLFGDRIPDHFVLHSSLGAATLGTLLSVIFTILFYPFLVSKIFRIEKHRVERECKPSIILVLSAFLGCISHVLLDFTVHVHNAIFWPFIDDTTSPVVSVLGQYAQLLVHILMGVLFVILLYNRRKDLVESFLVK